ncbi:MAG TPA: hypothetical protein VFW64_02525 [Pseudonocardiaceae bacterium]|nr:hypothetical protein [Pseudonocardiaceae bacterium]
MSKFMEYRYAAETHLSAADKQLDNENNIAAAHTHALLALAEAVRDVANAVRGEKREE